MATVAPPAPASFAEARRKRALESHQALSKALKEHRFDDALEHARTALALEPDNKMIKEFYRLLEEKQELDETDDDTDDEGAATGKPGEAAEATSSEDDDEDEDGSDEGEESEEESSEEDEEESEDVDEAVAKALSGLRLGEPEADPDQPPPPLLSAATRGAMRAKLAAQIKELKQGEMAAKLMAADPLLGA